MDHAGRRRRLADRLEEIGADGFLVSRLPNVRYLTGFTGSNGQVLLTDDAAVFFTDGRYTEQSAHEVAELDRRVYPTDLYSLLGEACSELSIGKLAFEASAVTVQTYGRLQQLEKVELAPTTDEVERIRWIKDPSELDLIARAQEVTDEAFERVTAKLAEGMTERDVAWELEVTMRESGAEGLGFVPIVAFGEQAAEPHHRPTDRPLRRGDVVKLDFGCTVEGYQSDMTRTVSFGEPPPEIREIHDLVARAHVAGVEAARAGAVGREVDRAARAVISEAGRGDLFGHSLGHGVGLEVHEGPSLRKTSDDVLPEGAVVTVEPGVYLPGVGGVRIEDMVVVGHHGARPVPRSTRELLVL